MRFYNTLTRKVEEFKPHVEGKVNFYTCGPTVYGYAHIGNMRNYVGHDILDRTLRYLGYDVKRCMNLTDVGHLTSDSDSGEDKMLKAARLEHKTSMEIAKFYTDAFMKDFKLLNCRIPDIISPATDNIEIYITIIEKLIKDGFAYSSGGNVYFDVSKVDDYYRLTNHKIDEMVVGAREGVEEDERKRNQADFALWFTVSKFANQELVWDSPFGRGYPGWHIECSGISIKYLGEYLDIHGGAVDNIFPHHTNEIAQSESYLGHKWCHYWFHNEHLIDENGKISKSKGATLSVSKLVEMGYNPLAYRLMILNSHFKKQLMFSFDKLKQTEDTYNKLKNRILSIKQDGELDTNLYNKYNELFKEALSDNLNTANALTVLNDVIKDTSINGTTKIKLIEDFDKVFALDLLVEDSVDIPQEVINLASKRDEYKKNKDYENADKIRDEIISLGYKLVDTREGTKVLKD